VPHLRQRSGAISSVINVYIADLLEQISQDADHHPVIVDDKDRD